MMKIAKWLEGKASGGLALAKFLWAAIPALYSTDN
jgi:hypothetical protein